MVLEDDAVWNGALNLNTAAQAGLKIDGRGHTIAITSIANMISNMTLDGTVTLTNITFTRQDSSATAWRSPPIYLSYARNQIFNLEGTTFTGFRTASADGVIRIAGSGNYTFNGGEKGINFYNNRGNYDSGGALYVNSTGTTTFNGPVNFESNWTGNYGGAILLRDSGANIVFNGQTNFTGNHAFSYGGAIDVWGGTSKITFNAPVYFDGNYIYQGDIISDDPTHVNFEPRGGAINIGTISNGAEVVFEDSAEFNSNYVISTSSRPALGGALSAAGGNYTYTFKGPAQFRGNYVYSTGTGAGNGGAIYWDAGSSAVVSMQSGTLFENNMAKTLGGAIYLEQGIINLTAATGDITFQGNRHGVIFTAEAPAPSSVVQPLISTNRWTAVALPTPSILDQAERLLWTPQRGEPSIFTTPLPQKAAQPSP